MLLSHSAPSMIGRHFNLIIPVQFQDALDAGLARLAGGVATPFNRRRIEVMARRSDGSVFPAELAMVVWQGTTGAEFGIQIYDLSGRGKNGSSGPATHDDLTGLLNRDEFRARVGCVLEESGAAAVLVFDLNDFKRVNGAFGHDVGDAVLRAIAARMTATVEDGVLLARVGGDDFALLLPGCDDSAQLSACAGALLAAFGESFAVGDHQLEIGVSIGGALAPLHAQVADELLVRANLALLRAKQEDEPAYRVFDAAMANEQTARRAFKDELRQAYERSEWRLAYQPQVCLRDGRLIGVEALLRWQHPTRGLLLPAAFMPVLEGHLVAYEVGCWAIEEACRQFAAWRDRGLSVNRVGVNLFASQFRAKTLERVVSDALMTHALRPANLEVEITETIAVRHDDDVLAPLQSLFDAGVGIALDDFGTGYASLSTLQRFPLTRLKIDRSFVENVATDRQSRVIVQHVAAIGHGLGLSVIAEGIRTVEQERTLLALGCQEGQGFRYGRPVDGEALARSMEHTTKVKAAV